MTAPYWHSARYRIAVSAYYALVARPARIALALPRNLKGKTMANFELPNDWILSVPIMATDAGGAGVPIPAGDTFTATSSNASWLNAAIGADAGGNPVLLVNALVPAGNGVTVTVSDIDGLTVATQVFDIVEDMTATNVMLEMSQATHTAQAVPAFTPPPPPPAPPAPP